MVFSTTSVLVLDVTALVVGTATVVEVVEVVSGVGREVLVMRTVVEMVLSSEVVVAGLEVVKGESVSRPSLTPYAAAH